LIEDEGLKRQKLGGEVILGEKEDDEDDDEREGWP
jgi:hypothetical protein